MRFQTPGRYDRCGSRLSTSPVTTRSVPPGASEGARTPVTPVSGPPPKTGRVGPSSPAPAQLTADPTTSRTTAATPATRPRVLRAQAGPRSSVFSTPPAPRPSGGGGQPTSAAVPQICANSSASRLAPPTSAPSTSGPARIPAVLAAFTDPP